MTDKLFDLNERMPVGGVSGPTAQFLREKIRENGIACTARILPISRISPFSEHPTYFSADLDGTDGRSFTVHANQKDAAVKGANFRAFPTEGRAVQVEDRVHVVPTILGKVRPNASVRTFTPAAFEALFGMHQ